MKSSINIDKKNTEKYIKETTSNQYFLWGRKAIRVCYKGDNWFIPYYNNDVDEIVRFLKYKGMNPKATPDYFMGFKCWIISF